MSKNDSKIKESFSKIQDFFCLTPKSYHSGVKETFSSGQLLKIQETHHLKHIAVLKLITHLSDEKDTRRLEEKSLEQLDLYNTGVQETISRLTSINQELSETSLGVEVYLNLRTNNEEILYNFRELFDRDEDCKLYRKIEVILKELNEASLLIGGLIETDDDSS